MITSNDIKQFIPPWDNIKLIKRDCPICGNINATRFHRIDKMEVAFCAECHLWYLVEIPSDQDIHKLYEDYYKIFRPTKLDEKLKQFIKNCEKGKSRYKNRIELLITICDGLKDKKILDIGCGVGELMVLLQKEGACVDGIEYSCAAAEYIKNNFNLNVFVGDFNNIDIKNTTYDVIIMNDFIEHVTNPIKTFEKAIKLLSKKGVLLIHTPNAPIIPGKTTKWSGFNVDLEHLQYFTFETINYLSTKYGLKILHMDAFGWPSYKNLKEKLNNEQENTSNILLRILTKAINKIKNKMQRSKKGSYHLLSIMQVK